MDKLFLKPRLSEKTYQSSQNNLYVFSVDKSLNKMDIKSNIEKQFSVTVLNVRVGYSPSKLKRSMSPKGRKVKYGARPSFKKAFVQLKKGDSIPVFAVEEAEAKKQEKLAKTLSKGKK